MAVKKTVKTKTGNRISIKTTAVSCSCCAGSGIYETSVCPKCAGHGSIYIELGAAPAAPAAPEKSTLLEVFHKALTEYYDSDRLAPGLVTAWLPDKQCFYASVARYPNNTERGPQSAKVVVTKVQAPTLQCAVMLLMEQWRELVVKPKKNHLDIMRGTYWDGRNGEWPWRV